MNIDGLKLSYEQAPDELSEAIINVIRHKSKELVDVLKFGGIITKENAETLIEFFNSLEEDTVDLCQPCHGDNFKECRRCSRIADLIIYLEKNKKETTSKTDVIDDLNFDINYLRFLSFLTVPVEISFIINSKFKSGVYLKGDDNLFIYFKGNRYTHILTTVSYDKNLFDILNDDGKSFFLDYYKKEIQEMLKKCSTTYLNDVREFFNLLKGENKLV